VIIDAEAANALPDVVDPSVSPAPTRFPIRFDDTASEVGHLTLMAALDFGSGYNNILIPKYGRSAHETIQFGILGLAMNGAPLTATYLKDFSSLQIFTFFGIDARVEEEVMPGVTMSKPGPLTPFLDNIKATINYLGQRLEEINNNNNNFTLGQQVLDVMNTMTNDANDAESFASVMTSLFPVVFQDMSYDNAALYQRKIQKLAVELYLRCKRTTGTGTTGGTGTGITTGTTGDSDLALVLGKFVPHSDAHTIAVLRHLGVIKIKIGNKEAIDKIDKGEDIAGSDLEKALRAAAVCALLQGSKASLSSSSGRVVSAYEIGASLAKKKDISVKVHVARNTTSY
jgi:hypothetical protein